MITMTEGKLAEGMSYNQILFGQIRSGGGRRMLLVDEFWKMPYFSRSVPRSLLAPSQAQMVLNAVFSKEQEGWKKLRWNPTKTERELTLPR